VSGGNLAIAAVQAAKPSPVEALALARQATAELRRIASAANTERMGELTGVIALLMHHTGGIPPAERNAVRKEAARTMRRCFEMGALDPFERIASDLPVHVIVGYPRSANTMVLRLLQDVYRGEQFGMRGADKPFCKTMYSRDYPSVRLLKDHVAHDYYRNDRCVFLMRDGRDIVISLAYMTQRLHGMWRLEQMADVIRWFSTTYEFGGWAQYCAQVRALCEHPDKLVVMYSSITNDYATFRNLVSFLGDTHGRSEAEIKKIYDGREEKIERLKGTKASGKWGLDAEPTHDSMFFAWAQNRKGSNWRTTFTPEARKAFHETGATEHLLHFGFETDSDWWRD
jgi:hypothetical protein